MFINAYDGWMDGSRMDDDDDDDDDDEHSLCTYKCMCVLLTNKLITIL